MHHGPGLWLLTLSAMLAGPFPCSLVLDESLNCWVCLLGPSDVVVVKQPAISCQLFI